MDYKKEILKSGMKSNFIAKKLNVHESTFSRYINGIKEMPYEFEQRLKDFLKIR